MSNDKAPPSELDALLQRGTSADDEEEGQQNNNLAPLPRSERRRPPAGQSGSHRKSYSVDVGSTGNVPPPRQNRHRKQVSSISQLYDSLKNVNLEPIREDFELMAQNLKSTLEGELQTMDRGETGFLDMSMNRSLSIIPDDIMEFGHEAGMKEPEQQVTTTGQEGPPLIQLLFLLGAVAGISSNSTALHMLDGVTPPLKLYWRMTASYFALIPMAVKYFSRDGMPQLTLAGWTTFAAAVLCFSIQNCLFYSSLEYTSIGNAVIYANSQALLLIIGKLFVGERIHWMEGVGVIVAFSGATLCSIASEEEGTSFEDGGDENNNNNSASHLAIVGDGMALTSAVLGVCYLTFAKSIRSDMSVTVFIFSVMFFGSFVVLLFIQVNPFLPLTWDMDIHHGVFGWLDLQRLPILVYLAVICNMIGTMGFVRAMEYFDNVIIAVATLMEPLMATFIAYAAQIGQLPTPVGWIGNILVVVGTLSVVYPSMGKGDAMH